MKRFPIIYITLIVLFNILILMDTSYSEQYVPEQTSRQNMNFNINWKFCKGDVPAAEIPSYDDSSWDTVHLPHGFEEFAYFSLTWYRGYGWYRKHFTLDSGYSDKKLYLYFEGAATVAEVWVNDNPLDTHYGAYNPFCYDITSYTNTDGSDNVIAVRLDNSYQTQVPPEKPDSSEIDFNIYGGIYRDVYLMVSDKLFIPEAIHDWNNSWANNGGTYVTCSSVSTVSAIVNVETWVKNDYTTSRNCTLVTTIVDADNEIVDTITSSYSIPAGTVYNFSQNTTISDPNLWYCWDPYMYTVYTTVQDSHIPVDSYETRIGIRKIEFSQAFGFKLNDVNVKILGLNRCQAWPYIGGAVSNLQQRRDAEHLKDTGCNFTRHAHYINDDSFMDACDELGIMYWIELPGWGCCYGDPSSEEPWRGRHHHTLTCTIRRARNHPGLILWGAGINEAPQDVTLETELNNVAHSEDPTRPTTMAVWNISNYVYDVYGHNAFEHLPASPPDADVGGYLNSEHTGHTYPTTRYDAESMLLEQCNRHENMTEYGRDRIWCAGSAGWCMFDYNTSMDVSGIRPHGVSDLARIPKHAYYFYQSQCAVDNYDGSVNPMVYIANFWRTDSPTSVKVYSNCEQVRLSKWSGSDWTEFATRSPDTRNLAHPPFTFALGAHDCTGLFAEGLISSVVVSSHTVWEPGSPAALELTADPVTIGANGADFSNVVATILDSSGHYVPYSNNNLTFSIVSGPGTLLGDNPYNAQSGKFANLVKASLVPGSIVISVTSNGLDEATVEILSEAIFNSIICTASPMEITADGSSTSLITAALCDQNEEVITTATNEVTFSVSADGVLTGTTMKAASDGVATVEMQSTTTSGDVTVYANSVAFSKGDVGIKTNPELPSKIVNTCSPDIIGADGSSTSLITALVTDLYDNICTTANNSISFSVSGPGSLSGTNPVSASGGYAAITLVSGLVPGTVTVTAAGTGLIQGIVEVVIDSLAPVKLMVTAESATIAADGVSASLIKAEVQDNYGDRVISATNGVTFECWSPGIQSEFSSNPAAADNGIATTLLTTRTSGTAEVTAKSSGLAEATVEITVEANNASKLSFEGITISSITLTNLTPVVLHMDVEILDEMNNAVSDALNMVTLTMSLRLGNTNWSLIETQQSNASGGVASFETEFSKSDIGFYRFEAVSGGLTSAAKNIAVLLDNDADWDIIMEDRKFNTTVSVKAGYADYDISLEVIDGEPLLEEFLINMKWKQYVDGSIRKIILRGKAGNVLNNGVAPYVLNTPATLKFEYEDDGNGIVVGTNIGEEELWIYNINELTGELVKQSSSEVNVDDNYVSLEVDHFSFYCLKAESPGLGASDAGNYPNPFNPDEQSTCFFFTLDANAEVTINVYTLSGRLVRAIESGGLSSGYQGVEWNGKDKEGGALASGVYFYKIIHGSGRDTVVLKTGKLVIIK